MIGANFTKVALFSSINCIRRKRKCGHEPALRGQLWPPQGGFRGKEKTAPREAAPLELGGLRRSGRKLCSLVEDLDRPLVLLAMQLDKFRIHIAGWNRFVLKRTKIIDTAHQ